MAVATALAVVAAGTAIYSGVSANRQAKKQRRLIDQETREAAEYRQEEIDKFASEQAKAYMDSGVLLEGSPLLVLKETREKGILDIQNMAKSAGARGDAVRAQGRSAFFQGVTSAIGYGFNAYSAYDKPKNMGGTYGNYTGSFSGDGSSSFERTA